MWIRYIAADVAKELHILASSRYILQKGFNSFIEFAFLRQIQAYRRIAICSNPFGKQRHFLLLLVSLNPRNARNG